MDAYCNIINNKEMKKDLWKNNVQIVQNSDFNYLSINNIFSASTNTKEIKKAPCILENSSMEGKLYFFLHFFLQKGTLITVFMQ